MTTMKHLMVLFVASGLCLSSPGFAQETGGFQSLSVDRNMRQPPVQNGASGNSSGGAPVLMEHADVEVHGGSISTSTSGQSPSDSSENSATGTGIVVDNPLVDVASPRTQEVVVVDETDSTSADLPLMGGIIREAGVSLAGKILDPAGQSVSNIRVKAVQGSQVLESITDTTGQYHFALPQGVWSVSATDLDYDITPVQKVYEVLGVSVTRIE